MDETEENLSHGLNSSPGATVYNRHHFLFGFQEILAIIILKIPETGSISIEAIKMIINAVSYTLVIKASLDVYITA